MEEYSIGEYIIYRNGEKYELGRIKSLCEDGAFVAYHDGETGAKTPYSHMHKLINRYCIKDTSLGGDYFKADTPQTDKDKVVCPNCGRSDYIRSFEKDFNIKNSEYRYKCINCNTYINDTPQTESTKQIRTPYEGDIKVTPQTERSGDEQN